MPSTSLAQLPLTARNGLAIFTACVILIALGCAGQTAPDLATRLATGERSAEDKARDAGRKPAAVVSFLGVKRGMTVVDLIASGGYYSEVFAEAVGPNGLVYAQNNAFVLQMRDGRNEKAISARLAEGRLPNVRRLDREMTDLGLEAESVDLVFTALNFHDVHDRFGRDAAIAFMRQAHTLLREDGVLGLIDHTGKTGPESAENEALHRIEEAKVVEVALASGFIVAGSSDVLRNPNDDLSQFVFADGMRGQTDRFVLKLRKAN
ncbi:MAG: class I SAM-dependent methyltransferase [Myxococcota bacterium]